MKRYLTQPRQSRRGGVGWRAGRKALVLPRPGDRTDLIEFPRKALPSLRSECWLEWGDGEGSMKRGGRQN